MSFYYIENVSNKGATVNPLNIFRNYMKLEEIIYLYIE